MNFEDFTLKINLDFHACRVYQTIDMHESNYINLKTLFYLDLDAFFAKINESYGDGYQVLLYLYIRFGIDLYDVYKQKAINDEVYFDTMNDISIWTKRCYLETGVWGIKEKYWLAEHLRMKIFKLGRLQFQPAKYQLDLLSRPFYMDNIPLSENTTIYFVHIPEGEPLTEALCEESYKMAKNFFGGEMIFFCNSWLLSPRLKEILNPESNILLFAARYKIVEFDENSLSIHKYLHDSNSSLVKSVQKYESNNKRIGSAVGYFKYKS